MRRVVCAAFLSILAFLTNGAYAQTACPTAPSLTSPPDGATLTSAFVELTWTSAPADRYDVYLGPAGSACAGQPTASSNTTSFRPPQLSADTAYEWKVAAIRQGCPIVYSPCQSFRTPAAAANCPTTAPILQSPSSGATVPAGEVTLSWSAVANALAYEVFASLDGGPFASVAKVPATEIRLPVGAGKRVDWFVAAHGDPRSCATPMESSKRQFTTEACVSAGATLDAPGDDATVKAGPITFSWSAVKDAKEYEIWLSRDGGTPSLLASTTSTTHTATLTEGRYGWAVITRFATCPYAESARRSFVVEPAASCPAAPVSLVAPADKEKVASTDVAFSWTAVKNAQAYTLLVSVAGGSYESYGTTTGTTLQRVLPSASSVRWLVVATAKGCDEVRSAVWSFDTPKRACADGSITLKSPANGATVASPVRFEWSAVADATAYRVWVSVGGSAAEIASRTTSTDGTVNLGSGAVKWYVEALRASCPAIVSPTSQFTISAATNCASNTAPTLVSPVGTQQAPVVVSKDVTVKWNAAPNAIAYRVWVARSGQPYSDVALTKSTEVTRQIETGGRFSWYVQAIFEGCPPLQSSIGYFEVPAAACSTTAATVLSPTAGSTVQSPVAFSWSPVSGASQYRLIVFKDGQPYVLGTTADTTLTRVLPPANLAFAVEAVFEECPSTFSARTSVSVAEATNCPTTPPQLLAPANGASDVGLPLDVSWSVVPNAVRYVVMVRFNGGEATPAAETTSAQASIRNLPAGRFEWWVLAFLSGCKPLESAHFNFSTAAPENCPATAAILFEPRNGVVLGASQVDFDWSNVKGAKSYRLWITRGEDAPSMLATTTESKATIDVPAGVINWSVEALFDSGCPSTHSARADFIASSEAQPCRTPAPPRANVVGQAVSGTEYNVRWTPLPNVERYEVQEATASDFADATTQTVDGIAAAFTHTVESATKYLYRVRAISSCSDEVSEYSEVVGVIVMPARTTTTQRNASAEVGVQSNIVQRVFVPGAGPGATFTATVDKKWLTVDPAAGALPEAGITLNVLSDPSVLPLGTNTGTVTVNVTTASNGRVSTHGTTVNTVPISISLVTPVTPSGKSAPPPDALIIPAVGHAEGQNDSLFESDIRLTNLSAQTARYQINFTPSGVDGTKAGSTSTVEVAPNQTVALDDVLTTMFGTGTTSVVGMLEIRPLTTGSAATSYVTTSSGIQPLPTAASSRTYNFTPAGTFGQYIPALPYSQFAGKGTRLSLQQIAQSSAFRTNFGFAEASGAAAELIMRVFDSKNTLLKEIPISLLASEHKQVSSLLASYGLTNLTDGRVEVEVTSSTGKVTAYASTVDNATNDPLLVWPSVVSTITANRYVVPGVAYVNTGAADWRTDVRIFNGGSSPVASTVTFYPQGAPGAPVAKSLTLNPGEIVALDNILAGFFAQTSPSPGGSVIVSTPSSSSLVATARTYNQTATGTYGQFIPAVTPAQAAGRFDRSLQLLQLEQSSRIRTNIGLAETTGNSATVEVSLVLPDSKATPVLTFDLAANEFRQIPVAAFGITDSLYNLRAAVRVTDGNGRVTAYASAIDMITQDPTYVPAQ